MAFETRSGTFTVPNGTGWADAVTDMAFVPQCVLIFTAGELESDGKEVDSRMFIGMSDGTNHRVTCFQDEDAQGTTVANERWLQDHCVYMPNYDNTNADWSAGACDFTPSTGTGFRLNWDNASSGSRRVFYIAFGGSDITNVKCSHFAMDTSKTAGQVQSITDPAFQPDGVIFICTQNSDGEDTDSSDAKMTIGFTDFTNEIHYGGSSNDNTGTSDCWKLLNTNGSIAIQNAGTGGDWGIASCLTPTANGFDLDIVTQFVYADIVLYIAFEGPQFKVGNTTARTTDGTRVVTGVGFQPTGILMGAPNETALGSGDTNSIINFGVSDGTNDRFASATSEHNQGTSNTHSRQEDDFVIVNTDFNNNPQSDMVLTSFDVDGFTLTQSGSYGSAEADILPYMCVGNAVEAGVERNHPVMRGMAQGIYKGVA